VAVLRFLFVDLLGFFLAYDLLRIQELLLIRFFFGFIGVVFVCSFFGLRSKASSERCSEKSSKVKQNMKLNVSLCNRHVWWELQSSHAEDDEAGDATVVRTENESYHRRSKVSNQSLLFFVLSVFLPQLLLTRLRKRYSSSFCSNQGQQYHVYII
jgi:uncharacterized membrane protein YciS (DUF1049 family)